MDGLDAEDMRRLRFDYEWAADELAALRDNLEWARAERATWQGQAEAYWGQIETLRARVAELEAALRNICAAFPTDDQDREHTAHFLAAEALRDVPSAGVVHDGCSYLAAPDSICTKCGQLVQRQGTAP